MRRCAYFFHPAFHPAAMAVLVLLAMLLPPPALASTPCPHPQMPRLFTAAAGTIADARVEASTGGLRLTLDGGDVFQADLVRVDKEMATGLTGQRVILCRQERAATRWGMPLVQVVSADEPPRWLTLDWVLEGRARVLPRPRAGALLPPLLAAEDSARAAGAGNWKASGRWAVFNHDDPRLRHLSGDFATVEGRVKDVSRRRNLIYINFADDWREDFTLVLLRDDLAHFRSLGKIETLEGQTVRLRGTIRQDNGPMMHLIFPEQIEFITHKDTPPP